VWWIRQSIGRAVSNTGRTIRLPVNRGWRISRLRRALAQLMQTSPTEPELEQVAKVAGVSPQAAAELLRDGQPVISLDAPPAEETERSVMERLADAAALDPEGAVAQNELQQIVQTALNRLDEREAQILRLRFGLDGGEARPLRTIATEWRMSPEGVRQISERAMEHLRAMPRVKDLGVYLEEF
jgi:RNA polymerase primary sigma factor